MKTTRHVLEIVLRFDKPIDGKAALAAAKDSIHGIFYPAASPAETMRVVTISRKVRRNKETA
jgi:hypothetical protein